MDLWIRSQDKTRLVKVCSLGYGEHNEIHYINGYCVNEVDNYDLGTYKTKERALEVLDEIDEFIDLFNRKGFGNVLSDDGVHQKHTIYEMPKE